jgi:hypothetical protein
MGNQIDELLKSSINNIELVSEEPKISIGEYRETRIEYRGADAELSIETYLTFDEMHMLIDRVMP